MEWINHNYWWNEAPFNDCNELIHSIIWISDNGINNSASIQCIQLKIDAIEMRLGRSFLSSFIHFTQWIHLGYGAAMTQWMNEVNWINEKKEIIWLNQCCPMKLN